MSQDARLDGGAVEVSSQCGALLHRELAGICSPEAAAKLEVAASPVGVPRVTNVGRDLFGLALSGGGVRSATFNLGVLQALHRLGWLKHVDYLSTVSGGGYIGGWWTRYLARTKGERLMPDEPASGESPQVRHLREFGKFLSPRVGIFEAETWTFVVAILKSIVPALMASGAVLMLAMHGALVLASFVGRQPGVVLPLLAACVLASAELAWRRRGATEDGARSVVAYVTASIGAVALTATITSRLLAAWATELVSLTKHITFVPAAVFAAVAVPCLAASVPIAAFSSGSKSALSLALDRVASRFIVTAMVWLGIAALPFFATKLGATDWKALGGPAAVAGGSGGLFVVLYRKLSSDARAALTGSIARVLKPMAPRLLAYAALVAALIGAWMILAIAWAHDRQLPLMIASAVVFVLALFFDPNRVGLHHAYRARIARAFLGDDHAQGAPGKGQGRITEERAGDDLPLGDESLPKRPLHLVCCTANDLSGDPLTGLDRGADSAVLSRYGVAVGKRWRPWTDRATVSLASAVTASAAAFNSAMGSLSKHLGFAAGFVMTSLNLRLGLWVPMGRASAVFKGLMFFRELLGQTRADGNAVHLSDGGHFENLGLYELVRRKCRYVLVVDCGADPKHRFDDLGNAVRRIRADFGVEIDLDVDRLTRKDGMCEQHVVVGQIIYPEGDAGTLILLKPSLTGDEPEDVAQYAAVHGTFPHESTGDQFYDEAQWESYRRLGHHVATEALDVPLIKHDEDAAAGARFSAVRQHWYPTPPGFKDAFLTMTERCAAMEREIRATAPPQLIHQVYPELAALTGAAQAPLTPDEAARVLHVIIQVGQLIEDVYVAGSLDGYERHPLNVGWINYFHRWTKAELFQMWWPVLRTTWSPGMRRFAEERLGLRGVVAKALASPLEVGPGRLTQDLELSAGQQKARVRAASLSYRLSDDGKAIVWNAEQLQVEPALWGAGVGTRFLREVLAHFEAHPEHGAERIEVTLKPAGERYRPDQEFYTSSGFRVSTRDPNVVVKALAGANPQAAAAAE